MKKNVFIIILSLIGAVILVFTGKNHVPLFSYVYSESMEPLIKTNDAFIVWPGTRYKTGDIVMYRPRVLDVKYVTHRIVGIGSEGFITKGDNSYYADQETGEPEVLKEQIAGKVVTVNGNPIVIPGLGKFSAGLQDDLGKYAKYLSYVFFFAGIFSIIVEVCSKRKLKPRHRIRLGDIYRVVTIVAAIIIMVSIVIGSRVTQVKYLVCEYPGTLGNQIEVGKHGQLVMKVENRGLIPVWSVSKGFMPLDINEAPEYIKPLSEETIILDVLPQKSTGYYFGYVQVINYPILLPRFIVVNLHKISPILAIIATGTSFMLWCKLLFYLTGRIPGFAKWIPVKAIKDKLNKRRIRRFKVKYLAKRKGMA